MSDLIFHVFAVLFAVDSPMVIDSSDDEDFECTKETTPEIRDIDTGNDIFFVTEYASEIFQYLKKAEVFLWPNYTFSRKIDYNKYFKLSNRIHWSVRAVIRTWNGRICLDRLDNLQNLHS